MAADDRGPGPRVDFLPADKHHVRRLAHRIRRFDHTDETARLDHAERVADFTFRFVFLFFSHQSRHLNAEHAEPAEHYSLYTLRVLRFLRSMSRSGEQPRKARAKSPSRVASCACEEPWLPCVSQPPTSANATSRPTPAFTSCAICLSAWPNGLRG